MDSIPELPTFAARWAELRKGFFDPPRRLPQNAPIVNTPNRATPDLLFQARKKILKQQDRKKVTAQLATSTTRRAAAVRGPAPVEVGAPPPAATPTGFGGRGYSGNVARQIGHEPDNGYTTPNTRRPQA